MFREECFADSSCLAVVHMQYNTFGDVIHNYTAPASGRIHTLQIDPNTEPGVRLVQIITERRTD